MYSNKQIWKVSFPILISLFVQNMINVTDTAFLGRVGEIELGASALAGIYYMAVYMIGFGFSIGSQILMARRNGEGRYTDIGRIMLQGCGFLFILAILMFSLTRAFSPALLGLLIHSDDVYNAAVSYMDYRIFGLFFSFISVMFRAFYVSITRTRILTINAAIMAISNIILNYLLVFGKFGFPEMGIAGAALGSVLAEAISIVFFVIYTVRKTDTSKYAFFSLTDFDLRVLLRILNVSVWTMIQYFLTIGTWFLFFVAVEHLGERQLAISNIVRSISTMIFIPVSAFATTSSSLVSNAMGAGRTREVIPICLKVVKLCYCIVLPMIVCIFLFPQWAIRIYTDDPVLLDVSVQSLRVMASFYLLAVPGSILFNTVSGTGNTRSALSMEMLTLVFYTAAIYFIIYYGRADIAWCWTVEHIYWSSMFVLSYIYLKKANWQSKKI